MKHKEKPFLEVCVEIDPDGIVEFAGEVGAVIMIPFKGTAQGPLFNGIVEPCGVDTQIINLISPHYLTSIFPKMLEKNGLRRIRFHDLRHPSTNFDEVSV